MVTGPMPKNPKATSPNANTAGAFIKPSMPYVLTEYAAVISARIAMPSQYALKLPATNPDRIFSDAPPSFDDDTTSFTCPESTDVKIFTSSGITAPANVPHVITVDNFHHIVGSPPRSGMI